VAPLKKYRGKVVVINFWATWCAPCLAEIPEFVRLQRSYRNRGLQVVGITYPPVNQARVRRLAVRYRINYPLLFGTRRTAELYGVTNALPVTVIVGRQGRIEGRIDGVTDLQEIKIILALWELAWFPLYLVVFEIRMNHGTFPSPTTQP
jgi:thiol-disulfide isomerase/thioredoxin